MRFQCINYYNKAQQLCKTVYTGVYIQGMFIIKSCHHVYTWKTGWLDYAKILSIICTTNKLYSIHKLLLNCIFIQLIGRPYNSQLLDKSTSQKISCVILFKKMCDVTPFVSSQGRSVSTVSCYYIKFVQVWFMIFHCSFIAVIIVCIFFPLHILIPLSRALHIDILI